MLFKRPLRRLDTTNGPQADSLSSMMSGLRLNNHGLGRPPAQPRAPAARPRRNIIEISDDDSSDVEQLRVRPVRGRRPGSPLPKNRRRDACTTPQVELSDSDESTESSSSDDLHNPRLKRAKLEHELPVLTKSSYPAVPKSTKVVLPPVRKKPLGPGGTPLQGTRPPEKAKQRCPYFYDAKLDCRMYRGPGFGRFPVAVGTIDGHEDICAEWDRRVEALDQDVELLATQSTKTPKERGEDRILTATLEIIPDIAHDFVRQQIGLLLQQYSGVTHETLSTELFVNHIFELHNYPREPKKEKKKEPEPARDHTGVTIPVNKAMQDRARWSKEPVILLAAQFPHIPTIDIFRVFNEKVTIFDSYVKLADMEETYFDITTSERPYRRLKQPRQAIEKKYEKPPQYQRDTEAYRYWVNEIQAAQQHILRRDIKNKTKAEAEAKEARNLEYHRANKSLVECGVCFDSEIPINRATTCQGETTHFFCFTCVNSLAESQIGQMKYKMLCMDGSGCQATLDPDGVGKAVPIKTVDRLALNQQQAEIAAAGIEGLEQCPYCDFKAILDPIENIVVFQCLNPDCGRDSCRKCKEEAHVPKTCEEFKNDRGLSARHLVEEARSDSVMRTCPKCKVKIIKELGCNKMTCTQCACIMCYICKADITKAGYDHFHKGGSKCQLYDQNTAGLHEAEAHAAELEAIKKAKAQDADLDEKALQIDTGKKNKLPAVPAQAPILAAPAMMYPQGQFERALHDDMLRGLNQPRDMVHVQLRAQREVERARLRREHDQRVAQQAFRANAARPAAALPQIQQPFALPAYQFPHDQQINQNVQDQLNGAPVPDFDVAQFNAVDWDDLAPFEPALGNGFALWDQDVNLMGNPNPPPQQAPAQAVPNPPRQQAFAQVVPQQQPLRYPAPPLPQEPLGQQQPLNAANLDQFNDQNADQNNGGNWGRFYGWLPFN